MTEQADDFDQVLNEAEIVPLGRPGRRNRADVRARRLRALQYRLAGLQWDDVAARAGFSNGRDARRAVDRLMEERISEKVEERRELENQRLDTAQVGVWQAIVGRDTPLDDRLKAVSVYLRISERRAKLNGLDAPTRVQITDDVRGELLGLVDDLENVIHLPSTAYTSEIEAPAHDDDTVAE